MSLDLNELTIAEAGSGLREKRFSSRELVEAALKRAEEDNPRLNSFITITRQEALKRAERIDDAIARKDGVGSLAGIPMAVKDILCTEAIRTTAASKILENYKPPYTATAVRLLEEEGAVAIGKTNCDEFAMGSSGENSAYGPTKNPWDLERVPGGSSSGSAAAVASGAGLFALGTDTGGSVRQPASFSGVVGLKPTYGRLSRYGVIALASSLDQVGIFTRTVEDCAEVLFRVARPDPKDSTTVKKNTPNFPEELKEKLEPLTIGLPKEYFVDGVDKEIRRLIENAVERLGKEGHRFVEVSLPHTDRALPVYYIILPAEASSNLARFDGVRYGYSAAEAADLPSLYTLTREKGFGSEVKRRIMLGTYVLSAGYIDQYYGKAQKVRTIIIQEFDQVFQKVDCLLTPTAPSAAFALGEKSLDPLAMYLSDIFTVTANIAGLPAISIPAGFTRSNLPVGMQLIGPHFSESLLLRLAYLYQSMTDWHAKRPPR
ncbi:MAG: Asp-tRNA(Asn)/Glu-tRNA(Gln) amidotransferase subunit GatA [bacterium]|nr:Asp-tRNA(Asn)/Glu-tRNA(Gln) amidotransferase subunit GatA [bacterium]